jgi:plastocyanin
LKSYFNIKTLFACLLLLYLPAPALAGQISGTIDVKGLRTPENILVYLVKAPPVSLNLSRTKFVMDQRNLTFIPHVLPVPVGAAVLFPNNDKVDHNIFSLSRTKTFNLGSYKPGEKRTVVFDKPGIVQLRCDVHAEMAAYIMVMQNPYFAVTDAQGRFEIPDSGYLKQFGIDGLTDIPAGTYIIKTWHEKLKTQKQTVVVPEKGSVSIRLELTRGTPGVLYK